MPTETMFVPVKSYLNSQTSANAALGRVRPHARLCADWIPEYRQ